MNNKFRFISMLAIVIVLAWASLAYAGTAQDSLSNEALGDTTIVYESVDVIVEFEWTDSESYEAINLMVFYKGTVATKFTLVEEDRGYISASGSSYVSGMRKICDYDLLKGMRILVFDNESGELIRTFNNTHLNI